MIFRLIHDRLPLAVRLLIAGGVLCCVPACQTPDEPAPKHKSPHHARPRVIKEPINPVQPAFEASPSQDTEPPATNAQSAAPVDPDCVPFSERVREPPFFIPEAQVMITRVAQTCTTENRKGYKRGSPWLAMGFPCTGSGGKVSWAGMQANPKAIHFEVTNACPMSPSSASEFNAWAVKRNLLPADVRIAAIYPFGLQYWQLLDYVDQDVGDVIDFVSQASLTKAWKQFLAEQPVRVRMYGRLNSFVQDGQLFSAEAELLHTGRRMFKVRVTHAEALHGEALTKARARCQELGSSRNCNEIFEEP